MSAGRASMTVNTTIPLPTTVGASSPPRQAGAVATVAPQVIPVGPAAPFLPPTLPTGNGGHIAPNVLPTAGNQGMTPMNALPVPPGSAGPSTSMGPGVTAPGGLMSTLLRSAGLPLGASPVPGSLLTPPSAPPQVVQVGVSQSDFNALAALVKQTQDALTSSVGALNDAITNLSNRIGDLVGQVGQASSLAMNAQDAASTLAGQANAALSQLSSQVDSQNQALLALARGATETFTPRKIIVPKATGAQQTTPSTVDTSPPSGQVSGFRRYGRRG